MVNRITPACISSVVFYNLQVVTVLLRVMIHELGVLLTQEQQLSEEEMRKCKHCLKAKDERKDGCKTQKDFCFL